MPYLPNLDGLRAWAVLAVLSLHGSYGWPGGGFLGVDLFFVLSGYLITSKLWHEWERSRTIDLREFYIHRALRLLPALVIALLLARVLWSHVILPMPANWGTAATATLFYYANIISSEAMGALSHCWSLSVEEHFYLLWPMLLLTLARTGSKAILYSSIAVLILGAVLFRLGLQLSIFGAIPIDPIALLFAGWTAS